MPDIQFRELALLLGDVLVTDHLVAARRGDVTPNF
jgi:hypothetical protein